MPVHRHTRREWLRSLLGFAVARPLLRAAPEPPPLVRILFLGNSMTYFHHLPETTREVLGRSSVLSAVVDSYAQPSFHLKDHVHDIGATTRLKRGAPDGAPWDVLVLQEQSMVHSQVGREPRHAREASGPVGRLLTAAREANPDMLVVMVQAWTRHPKLWPAQNAEALASGANVDEAAANIHRGLVLTLTEAIKVEPNVRVLVSPTGDFWKQVREVDPKLPLYAPDGHHPDELGTFLTSLVLAATIGGRQVIERTECPQGMPKAHFQTLKKTILDHPELFQQAGQ
ncbi:MAG: hypothetical protein ACK5TH_21535 [Prosthecobacter sp.]|jgi:hypothetical protein